MQYLVLVIFNWFSLLIKFNLRFCIISAYWPSWISYELFLYFNAHFRTDIILITSQLLWTKITWSKWEIVGNNILCMYLYLHNSFEINLNIISRNINVKLSLVIYWDICLSLEVGDLSSWLTWSTLSSWDKPKDLYLINIKWTRTPYGMSTSYVSRPLYIPVESPYANYVFPWEITVSFCEETSSIA